MTCSLGANAPPWLVLTSLNYSTCDTQSGRPRKCAPGNIPRPVVIRWPDGSEERYDSCSAAVRATGMMRDTIKGMLAGRVTKAGFSAREER